MSDNIHKIWGERRRILLTDKAEIDLLYLKKDSFCSTHKHKHKINKFVLISGKVRIETEFGQQILKKDDSFTVKPPLIHRFFALEDSIMIELAYTTGRKIDPYDIWRYSQGGRIINKKEMTKDEMRKKGLLEL
jgi:mannose-6-phosphate isomerase-like protein (cupin superfamily)